VGVTVEELAGRYPRLYHMAHRDSWESIRRHGLLSTSALLDLFEIGGVDRERAELRHRPESIMITHHEHGSAVIRDQKPLSDAGLVRALPADVTPTDWYRILNAHVFFWPNERRLARMLGARAYKGSAHIVLTVDTLELLQRHLEQVVLSPINSGATKPIPFPRNPGTFLGLDTYAFAESTAKRGYQNAVAEVAVRHSVPDVVALTIRAELRGGVGGGTVVWERA
jgi:hypothetical protein